MAAKIPAAGVDLDGAITINESSADKDFRVESDSNANCLHVDGGNSSVGINTTGASDATLQINDTVALIKLLDTDDNTFSRMYHSAGNLLFDADKGDSGSGSYMQFGVDDTEVFKMSTTEVVANDASNDQDFRVESNANQYALFVDAGSDEVGLGVNPSYHFHTQDSANDIIVLHHNTATSGNVFGMQIDFSSTVNDGTSYFFRCMGNDRATQRFLVFSNGNVESATNSYGSTSDERIKQDITDANSQWDDIKNLKVRNFKFKEDVKTEDAGGQKANTYLGLVAQEVESVSPGLVKLHDPSPSDITSSSDFGTIDEDGNITVEEQVKSVSYSVLYMKAIKALQEAMAKIEALETSNTDLKNRVTALEG